MDTNGTTVVDDGIVEGTGPPKGGYAQAAIWSGVRHQRVAIAAPPRNIGLVELDSEPTLASLSEGAGVAGPPGTHGCTKGRSNSWKPGQNI
jgi:hypothetical protein